MTPDGPLGSFEEQVLLAVIRTGRATDGGGAYGMAVRRELEEVTRREVTIGAVYATTAIAATCSAWRATARDRQR